MRRNRILADIDRLATDAFNDPDRYIGQAIDVGKELGRAMRRAGLKPAISLKVSMSLNSHPHGRRDPSSLAVTATRPIREDRASDDFKEMIGVRGKRGLVTEPPERGDQREQVGAVDIGVRSSVGLSTQKKSCAGRAHRDA